MAHPWRFPLFVMDGCAPQTDIADLGTNGGEVLKDPRCLGKAPTTSALVKFVCRNLCAFGRQVLPRQQTV